MFTSHFIARVRKGCAGFYWERELEIERNFNILTPMLWPSRCVFLVLLMLNWRPTAHSAVCWLSLLHLISIFSGPQTPSGIPPPVGCAFPYHISTPTVWNSSGNYTGSSNSTELYNRSTPTRSQKSNACHQAETTVMQFRGHSPPVHHSVVYHGNFFSRPISSANLRPRDFLS